MSMDPLLRHERACNNAALPGDRLVVLVDGQKVGWIKPALATEAAQLGGRLGRCGRHV